MMKKSGYFQKTACIAYDGDGVPHEIVEVHIEGSRHAMRRADIARAIAGKVCVQVEALVHHWQYYLGEVTGLARVSVSGKALNITIFGSGDYTVSLLALKSVLYSKERFAIIVRIPEPAESPCQRIPYSQQTLEAGIS